MKGIYRMLSIDEQLQLVRDAWAITEHSPLFQKSMPVSGANFKYLCTSAGEAAWTSDKERGFRYETKHPKTQKSLAPIPKSVLDVVVPLTLLVGWGNYKPQTSLFNFYKANGTLGLHRDEQERHRRAPIISFSLGADCIFQVGGLRRTDPIDEVLLKSGSVYMFGDEHRMLYHGVKKILPDTMPAHLANELRGYSRINITVRQID